MKAIIFGINSQDGYYLEEICRHHHLEVTGVSRSTGNWIEGDVSSLSFVQSLIKVLQPDFVFHLAANSTTKHAALFENHQTICTGTLNILESVKLFSPGCKVFITGSGVQFKNTGAPIKETDEFEASSAYAVSRIQSVYAARYYRSMGIKVFVGYLFHHESPLRKANHLSQYIVSSIRKILEGQEVQIEIGDMNVQKEWAFAGDIANGIFTLVNQEKIFEATIGTGIACSIQAWIQICFRLANLPMKKYVVQKKQAFKPEYHLLISNPETIHSLGWKAETNIEKLAGMMMKIN